MRRATIAAALVCSAFFLASSGVMAFTSTGGGPARCEEPLQEKAPFWQPFCRSGEIPQRTPGQPPERSDWPAFDERMAVESLCKPPKGHASDLFCRVDEASATVPRTPSLGDLP
jgi:hypothetical protein